MHSKCWRAFLLAWVAVACGAAWGQTEAKRECALGHVNSIFVPSRWPDRSLEQLTQGQLGVVDPRFDHFYLFIAYRRLAGKALTKQDLARLQPFDPCWVDESSQRDGKYWPGSPVMMAARREWDMARALAGPRAKAPDEYPGTSVMGYRESSLPNCNPDAFRTAARTLRSRLASNGLNEAVREWVAGQDLVMRLCFDASGALPRPAPPDAPTWLHADRAYQLAAAHFYAGHYPQAAQGFGEIGADAASPWQPWGRYLAARAWMRQASIAKTDAERAEDWQKARQLLEAALADPTSVNLRSDIAGMLQRVRLRIEPEKALGEIDARLSAAELDAGVGQDVRDFDPAQAGAVSFNEREPSFGAWLRLLRGAEVPSEMNPVEASPLVAVAWLTSAKPDTPGLAEWLKRAATVPRNSPAYQSIQLQRIRLLPDRSAALQLARQMLALPADELNVQDRNRVKALVLPMAQSAVELAALAYREPIAHPELRELVKWHAAIPVVDEAGAAILNTALPLDRLYAIQADKATPALLRRELLGVVWTRAFVLGRWDLLHQLQPEMQKSFPKATASLKELDAATDAVDHRAKAALFLILHPGILGSLQAQITYSNGSTELAQMNLHRRLLDEGGRDNWWCGIPASGRRLEPGKVGASPPPVFLSSQEQQRWRDEHARLFALPDGSDYLSPIVLAWAKANPRDMRLPPMLRMIMRTTRGGCLNEGADRLGWAAWRHLQRYFPDSEDARQTRRWDRQQGSIPGVPQRPFSG